MSISLTQTGNQRIKLTANHNHGSAATAFSVGYWVKLVGATAMTGDDISNHNGLHRHRGGTGNVAQERIWTNPSGVLNINSTTAFSADTWHFVVLTHSSAAGQVLYFDGVAEATASVLEPLATIAATAEYLGDAVPNFDAGDEIRIGGDFRIAGKALSLAEVQALYANRSGGGGTAKPQDHIATGVTVRCAAFDQTSGTVTNGDTGLADLGDVGNAWVTNTGSPVWVNDDPGHNWSTTFENTNNSPAYRIPSTIANLLHGGDCRVITLGDSFNIWTLTGRLMPFGWLLADANVNLTAFCSGDPTSDANGLMRGYLAATGTTYDVDATSYEIENGSGTYFGLPVHKIRGYYCDAGLTLNGGTRFVQYRWRNGLLATDGQRNWIGATDRAKARLLFLAAAAGANQLPDVTIEDVNGSASEVCDFTTDGCRKRYMDDDDPRTDGGGAVVDGNINAAYPDIDLTISNSEFHLDVLEGSTTAPSSNKFLQLAGAVCYKVDANGNRIPGLYYSPLCGNSWSYVGFNADTAATAGAQKTFSDAQVRPWLDVTTLDPNQRVIIIQNIADEINSKADHKTKLEALITRWDARCSGITTQPPLYLFIVQFAHEMNGDPDDERQNQINKADACYEIATDPTYAGRVGYVSLYQMMDNTYPTDDTSSGLSGGLAAYAAWATARGWDAFTNNGTIDATDLTDGLLDPDLHLNGSAEATAVGSLLAEAISESESSKSRSKRIRGALRQRTLARV